MSNCKILLSTMICTVSLLVTLVPNQEQKPQEKPKTLSPRELVILYTKTKMELAQVELEWVDWANKRAAEVVPKQSMERRRTDLAIAKEQYDQAQLASSGGLEKVRLCHAVEKARLARLDFERAQRSKEKKSVSELALKRYRLKYEIAELNLAMLKNPENYATLIEALQAQIDQASQQILALDLRVAKLEINDWGR